MEINWSTFVLEIINFLILLWILKHFLYKPVQNVIFQRKAVIDKNLADARKLHEEGERLQAKYENRLADWEKEKQQAHEQFMQGLEQEYVSRMADMQASLDAEKEQAKVTNKRQEADLRRKLEETALKQGARFAAILLAGAAGLETETNLVEMVIDELDNLPHERLATLPVEPTGSVHEIVVASAFDLNDDLSAKLAAVLRKINAQDSFVRFERDSNLLAGVRIKIGHLVLGANLQDELEGFATLSFASR